MPWELDVAIDSASGITAIMLERSLQLASLPGTSVIVGLRLNRLSQSLETIPESS